MRAIYKFILFNTSKRRAQWFWKRARRTVRPLYFDGRKYLRAVPDA